MKVPRHRSISGKTGDGELDVNGSRFIHIRSGDSFLLLPDRTAREIFLRHVLIEIVVT